MSNKPAATNGLPAEFNGWVRNFVHYDTLTASLNTQTRNAREVRDKYEEQITNTLKTNNMNNATLQISNGRLQLIEEKHPAPLTFQNLTSLLHDYFRAKGGAHPDETEHILRFIKSHRKNVFNNRLKRDLYVPPAPPTA